MPRAGLNEERVVEEAERIVDEIGLSKLTLAVLAGRLGVRQPSLYKHIAGIEAIHRLIAIRARLEIGELFRRAAVGKARGDAIKSIATSYRDWALLHPDRYAMAQKAPTADDIEDFAAATDVIGVIFEIIAGYGLSEDDAVDAVRTFRATIHGFISLESGGGFGMPVSIERSYERLVDGLITALDQWSVASESKKQ